ncbi:MAG: type I-C CRISPR-associated protein Cas5 [Desulfobacterium sp.]|nr:type I-C CRISPR-associated protein Cas5 [Desulfobacterium sp.]MBU3946886.1 type I-C CRISPR-associated protein Cas5c [Pseudomonadota bacterium]MBU4010129.1 type I-C CRISPR-associated protein Cas5c [Pseudomonadota bacterium]MBU4036846.1 type I-C CRISPR-associated protein Cas5c [Pseudomonadota bacterium]
MLDSRIVRVKVTGDFACFTRPDLKVERMTYPCMTPSAARGILDSILWKPEFQWYVRRIVILNPIRFATIKRNEINSKQGRIPIVVDAVDAAGKPKFRSQRNSVVLKDVAYIIEASIYQKQTSGNNRPEKYVRMESGKEGMFPRRVKKGQCWRRPYLGTREFSAEFMEPDGAEQPIRETIPIGSMLFDIFYNGKGKPEPLFFHDVAIRDGVLHCEVPENDKMMQSSHFQPPMDSETSAGLYEFNQKEEQEAAS